MILLMLSNLLLYFFSSLLILNHFILLNLFFFAFYLVFLNYTGDTSNSTTPSRRSCSPCPRQHDHMVGAARHLQHPVVFKHALVEEVRLVLVVVRAVAEDRVFSKTP